MPKAASARRYTDEFKKDAVALLRSSGRPIREVARAVGRIGHLAKRLGPGNERGCPGKRR